jgi:hypothetical protein
MCNRVVGRDDSPALVFIGAFNKLSEAERQAIRSQAQAEGHLAVLTPQLSHQNALLDGYPLGFLFSEQTLEVERESAIDKLSADVDGMLDRYSDHCTEVQVTTFVSMTATRKILLSSEINLPDVNLIFTAPDSDDARRLASMVRAMLNAEMGEGIPERKQWAAEFWRQAFLMRGCE